MKNVKKVINSAFQSGASFGAGLISLIISFLFFAMASKFHDISRTMQAVARTSYPEFRFENIYFRLVLFANTLGWLFIVIGASLIIIGTLTQYYRKKSIENANK